MSNFCVEEMLCVGRFKFLLFFFFILCTVKFGGFFFLVNLLAMPPVCPFLLPCPSSNLDLGLWNIICCSLNCPSILCLIKGCSSSRQMHRQRVVQLAGSCSLKGLLK